MMLVGVDGVWGGREGFREGCVVQSFCHKYEFCL